MALPKHAYVACSNRSLQSQNKFLCFFIITFFPFIKLQRCEGRELSPLFEKWERSAMANPMSVIVAFLDFMSYRKYGADKEGEINNTEIPNFMNDA